MHQSLMCSDLALLPTGDLEAEPSGGSILLATGELSTAGDVHGFGLLMLEVAVGAHDSHLPRQAGSTEPLGEPSGLPISLEWFAAVCIVALPPAALAVFISTHIMAMVQTTQVAYRMEQ